MKWIYEACQNSDLTEGRGSMDAFARFDNEVAAVQAVKGRGVMGMGDGEVYRAPLFSSLEEQEEWVALQKAKSTNGYWQRREMVYGYRKDWRNQWGSGYVDNRDAPINDPEYAELKRLSQKFGYRL